MVGYHQGSSDTLRSSCIFSFFVGGSERREVPASRKTPVRNIRYWCSGSTSVLQTESASSTLVYRSTWVSWRTQGKFLCSKGLVKRYILPTARPVGSASTTGRRITVAGSGSMVKTNGCDRCTGAGLKSSVVNPSWLPAVQFEANRWKEKSGVATQSNGNES